MKGQGTHSGPLSLPSSVLGGAWLTHGRSQAWGREERDSGPGRGLSRMGGGSGTRGGTMRDVNGVLRDFRRLQARRCGTLGLARVKEWTVEGGSRGAVRIAREAPLAMTCSRPGRDRRRAAPGRAWGPFPALAGGLYLRWRAMASTCSELPPACSRRRPENARPRPGRSGTAAVCRPTTGACLPQWAGRVRVATWEPHLRTEREREAQRGGGRGLTRPSGIACPFARVESAGVGSPVHSVT
jgi:hypothetical protein